MSATRAYVTAVVAGAMTAGIGAANVVAVPEKADSQDVDLAASITIPIIDIGPTPGPLSIWRELAITAGTNPLLLGLIQRAGNTYDLPGLTTTFDSNADWRVVATRNPGESIDFGAIADQGQLGEWELLGIVGGSSDVTNHRDVHFVPLLGGSRVIGFGLNGVLSDATYERNFSLLGSNLDIVGDRTLAAFEGETALMPFDGFKAVGGGTLVDATPEATFNLGSLTGSAGGHGGISGDGGLCLGSAQASESCGGRISFLRVGAPVDGALTLNNRTILSADFTDNEVAVELRPGQFSVKGAVGGTFSVGGLDIGRPIPIDIEIPRTSAMLSSSSSRQQQSVRNSFMAVPRKSASDNETGGRHRAGPLSQAVNATIDNVRTAVDNAVAPKHANPEAED